MQLTLRYMTKLDRAIDNEKELKELDQFYESQNITAIDLFNILVKVSVYSINITMSVPYIKHQCCKIIRDKDNKTM
jgi:hypothetical protein